MATSAASCLHCSISGEGISNYQSAKGVLAGHPLDPLTAEELTWVANTIRADTRYQPASIFSYITLQEPLKEEILAYHPGDAYRRVAQAALYLNRQNVTYMVLVDLVAKSILQWEQVAIIPPMDTDNVPQDAFGPYYADTYINGLSNVLLASPAVVAALTERGYTKADLATPSNPQAALLPFAMPLEALVAREELATCQEIIPGPQAHHRLFYVFLSKRRADDYLGLFAWLDGLLIICDATALTVVKVINEYPAPPVPTRIADGLPPLLHPPLNPLLISQPGGPSYRLVGNLLTWDNWAVRLSWHPRSGVQLYQITYREQTNPQVAARVRSLLYKASLSEAGVYYNCQRPLGARSLVSADSIYYPLLTHLQPLQRGLDVPEYATLLDIPLVNTDGTVKVLQGVIGIFEEDAGVLNRAINPAAGSRDTRLVVRFLFAGVIYLWTFSWFFSRDGQVAAEVTVSGRSWYNIAQRNTPWASLITANRLAFNHTHYYNYRLDFAVDGQQNSVVETNQYPASNNACGQTVQVVTTLLDNELTAQRDLDNRTNRRWTVINPQSIDRLGHVRGYTLVPSGIPNGASLAAAWSWVAQHYHFLQHHLHVTPYSQEEQFAAGNFPIMACCDIGLGKYIQQARSIVDRDIVVWYTMLFSHVPSTEDYPLVPSHTLGFTLQPTSFFPLNAGPY